MKFPHAVFVKELSFRTADLLHAAKVVQEIKTLRSQVQQREKEKAERATLVQQEKLIRGKVRLRIWLAAFILRIRLKHYCVNFARRDGSSLFRMFGFVLLLVAKAAKLQEL